MVDVWSRYIKAIPMKTKSAKGSADSLVTFIGELGPLQTVEVAHDNEPVVNAGVEQAKMLRNKVGLRLIDQKSKNFHKGRTAIFREKYTNSSSASQNDNAWLAATFGDFCGR